MRNLDDMHTDAVTGSRLERPHVQVAFEDRTRMHRSIGELSALVARRYRNGTRSVGHRQPIRAASVNTAIEAGYQHQEATSHVCGHIECSCIRAGRVSQY